MNAGGSFLGQSSLSLSLSLSLCVELSLPTQQQQQQHSPISLKITLGKHPSTHLPNTKQQPIRMKKEFTQFPNKSSISLVRVLLVLLPLLLIAVLLLLLLPKSKATD